MTNDLAWILTLPYPIFPVTEVFISERLTCARLGDIAVRMKLPVKKKKKNSEENNPVCREMGIKLRNFRENLALALGEKKLNQDVFGVMFGGSYSARAMSSYESGAVEIPSLMLYEIWRNGASIDALFAHGEVTNARMESLRDLYLRTVTRKRKVDRLKRDATERALDGAQHTDGKNEEKG